MTYDEIKTIFDSFIEFPEESDKLTVTTTSCILFARHIAEIAAEREREACAALRPAQAGDQWREAVEEQFSVNHTDMPEDPREAIKKLIATEVRDALDPTISSAAAALAQAGVPDGWRLVPVEPTQAMCQEGQWKAKEWPKFPLRITAIWQAMLAAAPKEGGASPKGGNAPD